MPDDAATEPTRAVRPAMLRGLAGKCPSCGQAKLFARFLKPVPRCPACGQDWSHQQADDFPAYIVIILLGHLLLPVVVEVNRVFSPGMLAQMILWPLAAGLLALAMIQPVKGAVIGLQWARRMHGFGTRAG